MFFLFKIEIKRTMKIIILSIVFILFFANKSKANNWMTSFEEARKVAIATNKLILVDFGQIGVDLVRKWIQNLGVMLRLRR